MRVLAIVGVRPQFMKAAPLAAALEAAGHEHILLHTGQHFDEMMSDVFFEELGMRSPELQLRIGGGEREPRMARMVDELSEQSRIVSPDLVLVYGDADTSLAAARAADTVGIPFAHVEAGVRSGTPIVEETNRIEIDALASLLLCPSESAVRNLEAEGVEGRVEMVGDVMADSIRLARGKAGPERVERSGLIPGEYVFATVHRAETVDDRELLTSVLEGLGNAGDEVFLAIHPRTDAAIRSFEIEVPAAVRLHPPLGFLDTVAAVSYAKAVATDSGGLQKEAYWLETPCVTMRDETEWVETVETGWNTLAGTGAERIAELIGAASRPSSHPELYGDGHAAERCVEAMERFLSGQEPKPDGSLGVSGVHTLGVSLAVLALGMLSNLAIARGLGVAGKGQFDLLAAAGSMLALFLGLSLPAGITYVVARGWARMATLSRGIVVFALIEGVMAALVVLVFGGLIRLPEGVAVKTVAGVLATFVTLSALAALWRGVMVGRRRIMASNRIGVAVRILQVTLVVVAVALSQSRNSSFPAGLAYLAVVAAAAVAALLYFRGGRGPDGVSPSDSSFREALVFSLPVFAGNLVQMGNYKLDIFFVGAFSGVAQVGLYALAVAISQLVWLTPQAVSLVILPSTAAGEPIRSANRAAQGSRIALWAAAAVALGVAAVSWFAVPVLFGEAFGTLIPMLLILLPGSVFLSAWIVLSSFVAGSGHPKLNLLCSAIALAVTVVLDLLLIPPMGGKGAALASSLSYVTLGALMIGVFRHLSGVGLRQTLVLQRVDVSAVMYSVRQLVRRGG